MKAVSSRLVSTFFSLVLIAGAVGCSGNGIGSGGGVNSNSPVTLTIVDPSTCVNPRFAFQHLYVTVQGVAVNPDSAATASSTGWVEIAPALATTPKQLDMFNLGTALGNLVSSTAPAGTYGSVRLKLAPNNATVAGNQCGTGTVNCVVPTSGTPASIAVATESTQGIVLNSDHIFGGTIAIASGSNNVNLLFDSCASLMSSTTGFRLLPVAFAWQGAVQTYNITLVDSVTQAHLGSGNSIVALEQANAAGVDTIIMEGTPDGAGVVTLFGPPSTFDVVAVAQGTSGGTSTMYSPLVLTGVSGAGSTAVNLTLPMTSQGVASPGLVTLPASSATAAVDLRWSLQQSATIGGVQSKLYTIPFLDKWAATLTSQTISTSGSTPASSDTAQVPSQPLFVQSAPQTSAPVVSSAAIAYTVTADAFLSQGAAVKNCTVPELSTSTTATGTISPTPGGTATATTLAFTGCQ